MEDEHEEEAYRFIQNRRRDLPDDPSVSSSTIQSTAIAMSATRTILAVILCLYVATAISQEIPKHIVKDLLLDRLSQGLAPSFRRHSMTKKNRPFYSIAQDSILADVGEWNWGDCWSADVNGNIALASAGRTVLVLDISNPDNPLLVGQYETPQIIFSIRIRDSIAYVGTGHFLLILDISNPSEMIPIVQADVGQQDIKEIVIEFPYAYILTDGQVEIVDISNPQQPELLGSAGADNETTSLSVSNHTAYLAYRQEGEIDAVDASDPSRPHYVANTFADQIVSYVTTTDTLLFTAETVFDADSSRSLVLLTYSIARPDTIAFLSADSVSRDYQNYPYTSLYTGGITTPKRHSLCRNLRLWCLRH